MYVHLQKVPYQNRNSWSRHACTSFYFRLSSPSHSVTGKQQDRGGVYIAGVPLSVLLFVYTHSAMSKLLSHSMVNDKFG